MLQSFTVKNKTKISPHLQSKKGSIEIQIILKAVYNINISFPEDGFEREIALQMLNSFHKLQNSWDINKHILWLYVPFLGKQTHNLTFFKLWLFNFNRTMVNLCFFSVPLNIYNLVSVLKFCLLFSSTGKTVLWSERIHWLIKRLHRWLPIVFTNMKKSYKLDLYGSVTVRMKLKQRSGKQYSKEKWREK